MTYIALERPCVVTKGGGTPHMYVKWQAVVAERQEEPHVISLYRPVSCLLLLLIHLKSLFLGSLMLECLSFFQFCGADNLQHQWLNAGYRPVLNSCSLLIEIQTPGKCLKRKDSCCLAADFSSHRYGPDSLCLITCVKQSVQTGRKKHSLTWKAFIARSFYCILLSDFIKWAIKCPNLLFLLVTDIKKDPHVKSVRL